MKKSDVIDEVRGRLDISSREAKEIVDMMLDVFIKGIVENGEVSVSPFGKFVTVDRAARICKNPQTGENIDVPAKSVVKFKPSYKLKNSVK